MISFILLTLFTYNVTCGQDSHQATIEVLPEGKGYSIKTVNKEKVSYQKVNAKFISTYYRSVNDSEKTDITVTLSEGIYHLKGTFKGSEIDKQIPSGGKPWVQHIGVSLSYVMKGRKHYVYECLRPTDMTLHEMELSPDGEETILGEKAVRVKNNPTGLFAKMWHCYFMYHPSTGAYAGYSAVEGVPGTPRTDWKLISVK